MTPIELYYGLFPGGGSNKKSIASIAQIQILGSASFKSRIARSGGDEADARNDFCCAT